MTSFALVLGVLPLALASGAGSASRHSVGTGVIGGMPGTTFLAILFVPLFFRQVLRTKARPASKVEPDPSSAASEPARSPAAR